MTTPAYPVILTATDWNAKKSAIAKLLPNTKLGDALRKLQETAAKINWDTLHHVPGVGATVADVDTQVADCTTKLKPQLDSAHAALADAKKLAADIKTAWASNKLVPSDSRKHLDALIAALDAFKLTLDNTVAAGLAALKQLRMKLSALNPHQAAAGKESTGPVVRTAPAHTGDVVVGLKPRNPQPK